MAGGRGASERPILYLSRSEPKEKVGMTFAIAHRSAGRPAPGHTSEGHGFGQSQKLNLTRLQLRCKAYKELYVLETFRTQGSGGAHL